MKYQQQCIILFIYPYIDNLSYLSIYIKNSFDSVVKDNGTKLLTRKKDKKMHGIGLQSVNDIVDKYRGEVELRYSGNEFLIQIVLYLDKH